MSVSFRPGQTPFNALAMALYELESPDRKPSVEDLDNRAAKLRKHGLVALTSALSVVLENRRILLHVDQFEEVFTACSGEEQDLFLTQILPSVDADNTVCRLVCTLRADFLGQLLARSDLGRRLHDRLLTISPMGQEAWERVVTEPARACDVTYEAGLAQQIARDAAGGGGELPLMQFALTELWPRQRQRRLTFADYNEFGQVAGALDRYAERVFAELEPRLPAGRIRRVMLACVRIRSGAALATRCRVKKDFFTIPEDWELAKQLADRRLLMLGADPIDRAPTVELAHEALIRSWTRLAGWVDDDEDFRRWLTITEDRVRDNGLLDEVRIAEAERWLTQRRPDIPPVVHQLVDRSKKAVRHRARTRRQFFISFVVLLVMVAGLIGFGISRQHTVAEQRIETLSRLVADEADRAGAADPSLAMQLSLAAYRIAPTSEARGSLLRASTLHAATRILGNAGAFNAVVISSDGHTLASGGGECSDIARRLGFPLIIKAAAGGGRGMTIVREPADLQRAYESTRAAAQAVFGDGRVYIERFLEAARHVEVQVLCDGHRNGVYLGERDCSVQWRHQKLLEETPSPGLSDQLRRRMGEASIQAALAVGYVGVGTFEFLLDADGSFSFMEINCRLQVEHPVTEMVTGLDLVREQLLVAAGYPLQWRQADVSPRGAAMECRINTEDPTRRFTPTPGLREEFVPAGGPFTRVDTHAYAGMRVTPHYDPLLAKVIVWAADRDHALARMARALKEFRISGSGVHTTIGFLCEVLAHPLFRDGKHTTSLVADMLAASAGTSGPLP